MSSEHLLDEKTTLPGGTGSTTLLHLPRFHPQRSEFLALFSARFSPILAQLDLAALSAAHAPVTVDLHPSAATYPIPYGGLLALADSVSGSAIFGRMGVEIVRGRHVLPRTSPSGAPEFQVPQSYDRGYPAFGPRELAFENMQRRIRVYSSFIFLLLAAGWVLLLCVPPGSWQVRVVFAWFVQYLSGTAAGAAAGDTGFSLTFLLLLTLIVAYSYLVAELSAKFSVSTMLGLGHESLPSVLRSVLHVSAPTLMVSYAWASELGSRGARSLAFALPDSWVDVRCLPAGNQIAHTTFALAKGTEALVLFVTPEFLASRACMVELAGALLARSAASQVTCAYYQPTSPACVEAAEMLRSAGFLLFCDARALLLHLKEHVYNATAPSDVLRAVAFLAESASPMRHLKGSLRLPAPASRRLSVLPPLLGRTRFPPGTVFSASHYITPDALELGQALLVSVELGLVLLVAACYAGLLVALAAFPALRAQPLYLAGALVLYAIVGAPIYRFVLTLAVDLDYRNFHSPLLLPINVAAFCNVALEEACAGAGTAMASASPLSVLVLIRSCSAKEQRTTYVRCKNIAAFLTSSIGVFCRMYHIQSAPGKNFFWCAAACTGAGCSALAAHTAPHALSAHSLSHTHLRACAPGALPSQK
jgi:hypothetical protein